MQSLHAQHKQLTHPQLTSGSVAFSGRSAARHSHAQDVQLTSSSIQLRLSAQQV